MKLVSLVKNVLLCSLILIVFLAVSGASQAQGSQQTNPSPTTFLPCGLPATWAVFNSSSTITTFELTADCTYGANAVSTNWDFLEFDSGDFTINGNGFTITGPPNGGFLSIEGASATVTLNNVTFRQNISNQLATVSVDEGRLNIRDVIFENNAASAAVEVDDNGEAYLDNVRFLNNRWGRPSTANTGSAVMIRPGGTTFTRITNAVFDGNSNAPAVIAVWGQSGGSGVLELRGCVIFRNNVNADGERASHWVTTEGGVVNDYSRCPKKKEKVPTATPTPRPRAVTCPTFSQATGIAVHATYGLDSGIQCQRLDGGGIGIQSIIDAGFIDAVDIWGYVVQGVEVCFPQAGRLLFLDASLMPRRAAPLESTVVNGQTCASISSPGSIVLMPN